MKWFSPPKKIISRSFLNSGTLIVNIHLINTYHTMYSSYTIYIHILVLVEDLLYTWSTRVSIPLSELGPPTPSPPSECVSPLGPKEGEQHSCGWGDGETQFGRLDIKPGTLYSLCSYKCTRLLRRARRFSSFDTKQHLHTVETAHIFTQGYDEIFYYKDITFFWSFRISFATSNMFFGFVLPPRIRP